MTGYMRGLNESLTRDVVDRQQELRGVTARIDQLRSEMGQHSGDASSTPRTPVYPYCNPMLRLYGQISTNSRLRVKYHLTVPPMLTLSSAPLRYHPCTIRSSHTSQLWSHILPVLEHLSPQLFNALTKCQHQPFPFRPLGHPPRLVLLGFPTLQLPIQRLCHSHQPSNVILRYSRHAHQLHLHTGNISVIWVLKIRCPHLFHC